MLTEDGFVLHDLQGVWTRPLPSLQLGDAVNEHFSHREWDPVEVAGCHFPDDFDDSLVVIHDHQEEEIGYYSSLPPGH